MNGGLFINTTTSGAEGFRTWGSSIQARFFFTVAIMIFLSSCKGASSPTAIPNSITLPILSVANASITEGSSRGITNLNFTVTLNKPFFRDVSVNYVTANGTALVISDYLAANGRLTIPAGVATGIITVAIIADVIVEPNETFTLTLRNAVNGTLTTPSAIGTILNDDAVGLNDTGVSTWSDGVVNTYRFTQPLFPKQDADRGRDANPLLNKNSDGRLGFSLTKLDSTSVPLINQAASYAVIPWDCVLDQTTGLMWEVKTPLVAKKGVRDATHTYTWYNSTGVNDGGNPGAANLGICVDVTNCDTEKYVNAVNALKLCGYTDWRLPSDTELGSIVDYGIRSPGPMIDTAYFPNTISNEYWSSTPDAGSTIHAWTVNFRIGLDVNFVKSRRLHIRLVR